MTRLLLAIALVVLLPWPAFANGEGMRLQCAPRDMLLKGLSSGSEEQPVARGLDGNGWMVELFTTRDGSTWSLVVTRPGAPHSCFLTTGEAWQSLSPEWKAKGDPL